MKKITTKENFIPKFMSDQTPKNISLKYAKKAGHAIAKTPIYRAASNAVGKFNHAVDKKAAPAYKVLDKGVAATNNYAWKHHNAINKGIRNTYKAGGAVGNLVKHAYGVPQYKKKWHPGHVNTGTMEKGAVSFADDAAVLALRTAGYKPQSDGSVISEKKRLGPFSRLERKAENSTIGKAAETAYKKVSKYSNNLRGVSMAATGATALGLAALGASGLSAYATGTSFTPPEFHDSYFKTEEKEKMNEWRVTGVPATPSEKKQKQKASHYRLTFPPREDKRFKKNILSPHLKGVTQTEGILGYDNSKKAQKKSNLSQTINKHKTGIAGALATAAIAAPHIGRAIGDLVAGDDNHTQRSGKSLSEFAGTWYTYGGNKSPVNSIGKLAKDTADGIKDGSIAKQVKKNFRPANPITGIKRTGNQLRSKLKDTFEELDMESNIKRAIDGIAAGMNQDEARELISQEIANKAMDYLNDKKIALAQSLFGVPPMEDDEV